MERRCSREQVSQKSLWRPCSTAVVQVSGVCSPVSVLPQKEQVTMGPAYDRFRADRGTYPAKPGTESIISCRNGTVASSWLSTPMAPVQVRWMSMYDGGRLSLIDTV